MTGRSLPEKKDIKNTDLLQCSSLQGELNQSDSSSLSSAFHQELERMELSSPVFLPPGFLICVTSLAFSVGSEFRVSRKTL